MRRQTAARQHHGTEAHQRNGPMARGPRSRPDLDAAGSLNPEMRDAFTVVKEVVYSPIVPASGSATTMSDPDITLSVAPTMSRE